MTKLEIPSVARKASYLAYIDELQDEERYPYPLDLDATDFDALVNTLLDYAKGINLPAWLVPNSTYWLVSDTEIIGCSHLRHCLNAELAHAGGHIGLGVRPSYRGKGFGKILLDQTIQQAFSKNIDRIHIHCHASNLASRQLIESAGAILDAKVKLEKSGETVLKYIVERSE